MFLLIAAAAAATPLPCDGLDADLCATVNDAADQVNLQFGFDFFDASDDVPNRRRTSTLYAQLLDVSERSQTCKNAGYRGFVAGTYTRGVATGVSEDETGSGTVNGTFSGRRTTMEGSAESFGSVGVIGERGRYANDRKTLAKRHGDLNGSTEAGYAAGVFVRHRGKVGAFVNLYGGCDNAYYEDVYDTWYPKADLARATCSQGEEITSVRDTGGQPIVGNTCDGEGAIPFTQARSTEHTGQTYVFRAPATENYIFFYQPGSIPRPVLSLHRTCDGGALSWTESPNVDDGVELILQAGETILISIGGRLDQCVDYTLIVRRGAA